MKSKKDTSSVPKQVVPSSLDLRKARRLASRKRISSACVSCSSSRTKCDGFRPCKRCLRLGREQTCTPTINVSTFWPLCWYYFHFCRRLKYSSLGIQIKSTTIDHSFNAADHDTTFVGKYDEKTAAEGGCRGAQITSTHFQLDSRNTPEDHSHDSCRAANSLETSSESAKFPASFSAITPEFPISFPCLTIRYLIFDDVFESNILTSLYSTVKFKELFHRCEAEHVFMRNELQVQMPLHNIARGWWQHGW